MNKSIPVIIVVQDFLLRVLALLDIDDADLELGLDEDLVKLHQLLAGVRQLTEGEWGVQVDLPTETCHHLQHYFTNLFLHESERQSIIYLFVLQEFSVMSLLKYANYIRNKKVFKLG